MTARSATWNSGRLDSISATVSPLRTPSRASPPASASTRASSCPQVRATSSSLVRNATRSGWSAAVMRNASAIVAAPTARLRGAASIVAIAANPYTASASDVEAAAEQSPDVVGQPDHEQEHDEREADEPRSLHHAERDRAPAHL